MQYLVSKFCDCCLYECYINSFYVHGTLISHKINYRGHYHEMVDGTLWS